LSGSEQRLKRRALQREVPVALHERRTPWDLRSKGWNGRVWIWFSRD